MSEALAAEDGGDAEKKGFFSKVNTIDQHPPIAYANSCRRIETVDDTFYKFLTADFFILSIALFNLNFYIYSLSRPCLTKTKA